MKDTGFSLLHCTGVHDSSDSGKSCTDYSSTIAVHLVYVTSGKANIMRLAVCRQRHSLRAISSDGYVRSRRVPMCAVTYSPECRTYFDSNVLC